MRSRQEVRPSFFGIVLLVIIFFVSQALFFESLKFNLKCLELFNTSVIFGFLYFSSWNISFHFFFGLHLFAINDVPFSKSIQNFWSPDGHQHLLFIAVVNLFLFIYSPCYFIAFEEEKINTSVFRLPNVSPTLSSSLHLFFTADRSIKCGKGILQSLIAAHFCF